MLAVYDIDVVQINMINEWKYRYDFEERGHVFGKMFRHNINFISHVMLTGYS